MCFSSRTPIQSNVQKYKYEYGHHLVSDGAHTVVRDTLGEDSVARLRDRRRTVRDASGVVSCWVTGSVASDPCSSIASIKAADKGRRVDFREVLLPLKVWDIEEGGGDFISCSNSKDCKKSGRGH